MPRPDDGEGAGCGKDLPPDHYRTVDLQGTDSCAKCASYRFMQVKKERDAYVEVWQERLDRLPKS